MHQTDLQVKLTIRQILLELCTKMIIKVFKSNINTQLMNKYDLK